MIRGRRVLSDTVWNLVGSVLPGLIGILLVPSLVRALGDEGMGTMGLAWATIGYASLFDFGLGRAITKFGADRLARGDKDGFLVVLSSGIRALGYVGAGLAVVAAIAGWYASSHWLQFADTGQRESATRAFFWIALSLPAVLLSAGLRGALEAGGHFFDANLTWFPFALMGTVLPVVALRYTSDVSVLVAVIALVRWLSVIGFVWALRRHHHDWRFGHRGSPEVLRGMLAFGSWITLSGVISPIMLSLDRFLLGSVVAMAAVAPYVVANELASKILVLPRALAGVLFPRFSVTDEPGRRAGRLLYRRARWGLGSVMAAVAIGVVLFATPVLSLWVGAEMAAKASGVLRWFAFGMALNGLAHIPYSWLQGHGRADLTAKFHLVEAPLHLILLVWLVSEYSVKGAAIAWAIRAGLDLVLLVTAAAILQGWQVRADGDA